MSGQRNRSGGQNRLPTERKRAQGTLRKSRLNPGEPQLQHALPSAPAWLPKGAQSHFTAIAQLAFDAGVTSRVDGEAIALAALALEEFLEADACVRRDGLVLIATTESGERQYKNPAVPTRADAWNRYRAALRSFGLDPQSRASVSSLRDPRDDIESKYFQ